MIAKASNTIICLCLGLLLCLSSNSQETKFVPIGTEEGLMDLTITSIAEDERGYMWFGTRNGLHRYDGYEFVVYSNDPTDEHTLSSNVIISMLIDRDGIIWIGTEADGLNSLDPVSGELLRYKHLDGNSNSIIADEVYALCQSEDGLIWIGSFDEGYTVYDKQAKSFTQYHSKERDKNHVAKGTIWDIMEASDGTMWFSTWGGGLNSLDRATGIYTHYYADSLNDKSISSDMAGPMLEDSFGNIWVTTWGFGLEKLDPKSGEFEHYTQSSKEHPITWDRLWPIIQSKDGKFWLGTYDQGLDHVDPEKGVIENFQYDPRYPRKFVFNNIWSLYEDKHNIVWIGTEGGGLMKYSDIQKRFKTLKPTIKEDDKIVNHIIRSIASDRQGNVWIGSWYHGLMKFEPATGTYVSYKRKDENGWGNVGLNQVRALLVDSKNRLWVGSNRQGAYYIDLETDSLVDFRSIPDDPNSLSHNNVRSLCEDANGNIWIGTTQGLNMYDEAKNTFVQYRFEKGNEKSIPHHKIHTLAIGPNDHLWVGTDFGICEIDINTAQVKRLSSKQLGLSHSTVYNIFKSKEDDVMWMGTLNGLNSYDPKTGKSETYFTKEKGKLDHNKALIEDGRGNIWLSTSYGLLQFDKSSGSFSIYDETEGLQVLNYTYGAVCSDLEGRIYFGGIGGVTTFDPETVQENNYGPRMLLTGLLLDGERQDESKRLHTLNQVSIPYSISTIEIEYTGFSYHDPDKTRYAYKLEGYDDDWRYVGKLRKAQYSGLDPGTYVFKVKASNEDGVWSEKEVELTIVIPRPFWMEWWFYALVVLSVIALIWIIVKWRMRKLEKEKDRLEDIVEERTVEIRVQRDIIEEKNQEMLDSINYAEGIQRSILPSQESMNITLPNSFVLFMPKDIVSGDFYWMHGNEEDKKVYAAVADCTGHGVPGAFVSMVGANGLKRTVNEYGLTLPNEILDKLTQLVEDTFKNRKDGMDLALCAFDSLTKKIEFSGANNPLYIVRKKDSHDIVYPSMGKTLQSERFKLFDIKGSRQPIGAFDEREAFKQFEIQLQDGDCCYMFTDGYADQFGGPKGKKFKYSNFKKLLLEVQDKPMAEQESILKSTIISWMGDHEQIDDICVMGFKVD